MTTTSISTKELKDELQQRHPYIQSLFVKKYDWEILKTNPYDAVVDMFVPLFESKESERFFRHKDLNVAWSGYTIKFKTEGRRSYCKTALEDLRIVSCLTFPLCQGQISPEEFKFLWRYVADRLQHDETADSRRIIQWFMASSELKNSYQLVFCTTMVDFVMNMDTWPCTAYILFKRWLELMSYFTRIALLKLEHQLERTDGEALYMNLLKKLIVSLEKVFDQKPGVSLTKYPEGKNFINMLYEHFGGPKIESYQKWKLSMTEVTTLNNLTLENGRRLLVQSRVVAMLKDLLNQPPHLPILNIREYLFFDSHGPDDSLLIFVTTETFLEENECGNKMRERILHHVLMLVPIMPFVLQNHFSTVCPQTVLVEADNSLLREFLSILSRNMAPYSGQPFDVHMCAVALSKFIANKEWIDSCRTAHLPYLNLDKKLSDEKVASLFSDSSTNIDAATFYRLVFEDYSKVKFLQGELLFALTNHVREFDAVRNDFSKYIEETYNLFLKDTNSTLDFGALLTYYDILKKFMETSQAERIKERLHERQKAERTFLSYFFSPSQRTTLAFKSYSKSFPYVFFLAFVKVFMFHTQNEQKEEQQRCINRLVDTLEFYPNLKELLNTQDVAHGMHFHEFLYKKLTTSAKSAPLDQLKNICSNDWGNVLASASPVRFKSYEESALIKLRVLSEDGGQADVTLVQAPRLSVDVVAKFFRFNGSKQDVFMQMREEIRSLLSIQCHPNIVSLYGYIVDKHEIVGLLMEHCKGGSLSSVIKSDDEYSEDSIIRWSQQAACGLEFIHASQRIHRDVKPHNMLLNEDHQLLKISDLGLIKLGTRVSEVLHCDNTSDIGTYGYNAPERANCEGDTCTPKVDVFGLGRSIWSMIFRCNPKEPLDEKLTAKVGVSSEIIFFIKRMMEHDSKARPTMEEVYNFFEEQRNLHS